MPHCVWGLASILGRTFYNSRCDLRWLRVHALKWQVTLLDGIAEGLSFILLCVYLIYICYIVG